MLRRVTNSGHKISARRVVDVTKIDALTFANQYRVAKDTVASWGKMSFAGVTYLEFPQTPAVMFLMARFGQGASEGQAASELMLSDLPLDTFARDMIATILNRYQLNPPERKRREKEQQLDLFREFAARLQAAGIREPDAKDEAARLIGKRQGRSVERTIRRHRGRK
jgi:hypothetical protein